MKRLARHAALLVAFCQPLAAAPASPIAAVLQSLVEQHIAPGVVALVANKDGVIALEKAGYASLADTTPMREDAMFWIASMSKSI